MPTSTPADYSKKGQALEVSPVPHATHPEDHTQTRQSPQSHPLWLCYPAGHWIGWEGGGKHITAWDEDLERVQRGGSRQTDEDSGTWAHMAPTPQAVLDPDNSSKDTFPSSKSACPALNIEH